MKKETYPNHYLMKQNRLIKLQQTKSKCEICKEKANLIHHINGDKSNHQLKNLIVLCKNCHKLIDRSNVLRKTSKFIRKYGMTLEEMEKKFKKPQYYFYKLHKKCPQLLLQMIKKRKIKNIVFKEKDSKPTSKYRRLYGMTFEEMVIKFGGYWSRYYSLHKRGTLKDFLKSKIKHYK